MNWFGRLLERATSPFAAAGKRSHRPVGARRLLVDVSTIAQHDAGTGIQRVVRAIWLHLHRMDLGDIELLPVAATVRRGYSIAGFDPQSGRLSLPESRAPLVQAGEGDLFLGLDLAAHRLARHERQLKRWRKAGASLNIMVYDLLPLRHPEWFPKSTSRNFARWIGVLARCADRAICISHQVASDLDGWLAETAAPRREEIAMPVIPLSGAVEATNPTSGIGDKGRDAVMWAERVRTVLMVGTIEPRKGHDCVLDAMTHLWETQPEAAPHLVVVGQPGWRTESVQARMAALESTQFTWLSRASDELLGALYERAALVIVPSRGEGFGLPIVEALRQGRKVLARDLPVFRELERPGLSYFTDDAPAALSARIMATLEQSDPEPWTGDGWDDSALALLNALNLCAAVDPVS
ncbi:glycosyltransferase involved in cell wall biosynthesis [Sphingobium sp. OAS761]|uniref:glycosyltransferase family 4 protein n=1 Tax=Sphingobium sp. OAS761 TaxID=2817901 RepID=UPI00209D28FF|nr:glycosyltransferase family 1 protein [Sphingobium sp. OAS761]MCP1470670.1 glycosyltransferase involved in cell wall biosynthesis [Sphingobium sp. OAS761]